ncbi:MULTISPECIES: ABC transporter permease [Bacillus]|uniref:ABC transporter permease n=1 Tax=Bacillus TaxID=1386 RepID=UPI00032EC181|nr:MULTISPECIES: ABC transporter permease [Bacillus]EOP29262.1 ABC transporter permease [Bacillus cereus VD131]KAF6554604.1 ABC transporter permease [Bacillus sp. EKM202B]MBJ8041295.1 ABC transporter permease [Bacillus cereus group sp. N17]MCU5724219.1 ABC transporter permease [Bacillus toyonensis]MDD9262725.1 ABC transporter permease [Bacillus toyonensis]
MSIESLWSSRFQQHMQNIITYFARMINGLLYSFIFISCVGAYYYAQFLKASPSKGISLLLITIVLTFIITRCPIRTFIQKPDAVYLLALEEKLTSYFKKSLLYNYIIQLFPLLFTFLILVPLAMQSLQLTVPFLCTIFIVLMITKAWNMYIYWMWRDSHEKNIWFIIRIACNALIIYMLFYSAHVLILGGLLLLLAFLLLYTKKQPTKRIPWDYIIEQEEKMNVRFYQFASIFTDVPQLNKQVNKRKWLTNWIERLLHKKRETFFYLHTLAFLRGNDYFGIYIRLGLIGAFALYFIPNTYVKGAIAYIVLYMISMQLRSLWKYFSGNIIVALYPIDTEKRMNQFLRLIFILLSIQLIVFSSVILIATGQLLHTLIIMIIEVIWIKFIIVPKTKQRVSSF